jgi:hypothetical protein
MALMAGIDSESSEQDDRYGLVGRQTLHGPRRCFARHRRTGRECVVAGDIWIGLGRGEHAKATAAMALEAWLRSHSSSDVTPQWKLSARCRASRATGF